MITYEQNGTTIVAKFSQDGKTLKRIWQESLWECVDKYTYGTAFSHWGFADDITEKVLNGRKLVGIAKCHPNDKFNLEEGKRLARVDLINRFNLAKAQLKKEILYAVKHDVKVLRDRM